MKDQISANSGRGLLRRRELLELYNQTAHQKRPQLDRSTRCYIRNETGVDLPILSVLEIAQAVSEPDELQDVDHAFRYVFSGVQPTNNDTTRVAIVQSPVDDQDVASAIYAGVTSVLITGDRGKGFATTQSGLTTLVTADSGPFEVLYDFGDVLTSNEERYAVVRFGSAGVGSDCPEIWVFLPLAPTAGTFDVTFTFNGVSDTVTLDWDEEGESGTGFATAWATHSEVSSSDFAIYGGDFPTTAIYVHWLTSDASVTGSFPSLDLTSLTGAVTFYKLTLNNI